MHTFMHELPSLWGYVVCSNKIHNVKMDSEEGRNVINKSIHNCVVFLYLEPYLKNKYIKKIETFYLIGNMY